MKKNILTPPQPKKEKHRNQTPGPNPVPMPEKLPKPGWLEERKNPKEAK